MSSYKLVAGCSVPKEISTFMDDEKNEVISNKFKELFRAIEAKVENKDAELKKKDAKLKKKDAEVREKAVVVRVKDEFIDELFNKVMKISEEKGALKMLEQNARSTVRVQKFVLNLRSTMDEQMRNNFPFWVTQSGLSYINQWRIMFRMQNNRFITIIKNRLDSLKITEEQFVASLKLFRSKINVPLHQGDDVPVIDKQEDWDKIYKMMNLRDYPTQSALQVVGKGIEKSEIAKLVTESTHKRNAPSVLLITGAPPKYEATDFEKVLLNASDEEWTEDDAPVIEEILFAFNDIDDDEYTGEIAVFTPTFIDADRILMSKQNHIITVENPEKDPSHYTLNIRGPFNQVRWS
ncbi:uncharacterized protein LOC135845422 [Planococcus citri]|uniref:uncharacterized protein LOC135845422 n=1 Tax=Planococcus citri TaxID=170843 RepID=UPI0031F7DE05